MENEIKLAHYARRYMTTSLFLSYIKSLSKINACMGKYFKTGKELYQDECRNILLTVNNSINIYKDIPLILFYIDKDYKDIIKNMMEPD
jgi:hypothetical protein